RALRLLPQGLFSEISMKRVFIAGCGYIGGRVARLLRGAGAEVTCMVRSGEHGEQLRSEGFDTLVCALDDPDNIPALDVAGSVLCYFVPPPGGGITDIRARNFCTSLAASAPPEKIIYMSATSVY